MDNCDLVPIQKVFVVQKSHKVEVKIWLLKKNIKRQNMPQVTSRFRQLFQIISSVSNFSVNLLPINA